MKCPFCSSENTRVIDSRPADDNNSIRRRRLCDDCGKRFTTYEKVETIPLIVIKKDNAREQYDRSKIEAGVLRACHKRPISVNQINQLVDEVETEIDPMPFVPGSKTDRERRCDEILSIQAMGLKKRLEHTHCKSAVIGISGGLDSTLALLVTVRAFDLLGMDLPAEHSRSFLLLAQYHPHSGFHPV